MKKQRKLKLKKGVKKALFIIIMILLAINFINNFNNVTTDEQGNTCQGGIIKICHN